MFDTAVYETLMLALDDGAVTLPDEGPILFLRAELSPHLARLPKERLVCQNSFKPDHEALKAAGFDVLPPETETFPATQLTLLLPPRQKDETRALFARALRDAPEGGVILACLPNTLGSKTIEKLLREIAGRQQVQIDPTKLEKIPSMNLLQKASLCIIFGEAEDSKSLL